MTAGEVFVFFSILKYFIKSFFKKDLILRARGREGETEGEKH